MSFHILNSNQKFANLSEEIGIAELGGNSR